MVNKFFSKMFIFIVRFYQLTFAYLLGGSCRFNPSCSNYSIEAIKIHGPFRGAVLSIKRIFRCHPFGGSGDDPVPPKEKK
jgi:putative membrane protein insertion efficiency factor